MHSGTYGQLEGAPGPSALQTKEPPADRSVSTFSTSQSALRSAQGLFPQHAPRLRLQPGTTNTVCVCEMWMHSWSRGLLSNRCLSALTVQCCRPPLLLLGGRAHPALLQTAHHLDGDHAVLGRPAAWLHRASAGRSEPACGFSLPGAVCPAIGAKVRSRWVTAKDLCTRTRATFTQFFFTSPVQRVTVPPKPCAVVLVYL